MKRNIKNKASKDSNRLVYESFKPKMCRSWICQDLIASMYIQTVLQWLLAVIFLNNLLALKFCLHIFKSNVKIVKFPKAAHHTYKEIFGFLELKDIKIYSFAPMDTTNS